MYSLVKAAKERILTSSGERIQGAIDRCTDYHEFYLVLRIRELHILLSSSAQRHSSLKALWEIIRTPVGLEYAKKNIDIELYGRKLSLWATSLPEFEGAGTGASPAEALLELHEQMIDAIKGGDANWATITTAIQAAWEYSKLEKGSDLDEDWWTAAEDSGSLLRRTKCVLEELGDTPTDQSSSKDRGHTLGLLYLACYGMQHGMATEPATALPGEAHCYTRLRGCCAEMRTTSDLITLYISRHGNRNCCFEDLRPYLAILEKSADREQLSEAILAWLETRYTSSSDIDVSVSCF